MRLDKEAAQQLAGYMDMDCASAAYRLQEAFRGLVYVALLQEQDSMVRDQ